MSRRDASMDYHVPEGLQERGPRCYIPAPFARGPESRAWSTVFMLPRRAMAGRPESGAAASSMAAQRIRALLNRHGVPPMRHVTLIASILGFGYTQVHRRMNGAVAWEVEEIEKVAAHHGETLADIFGDRRREDLLEAVLLTEGARVSCRLQPGDVIHDPDIDSLVAIQVGMQWTVVAASRRGTGPCYRIERLELSSSSARPKRIAILDDDASEAASLADYFEGRGCEAYAFTETEPFLMDMKKRRFDGYVIDWVLGEGSASELVAMIRAEDRECPIAILTGKLAEDVSIETDVAEALASYKLMFFQKPTRLPLLASQVLRAIWGSVQPVY